MINQASNPAISALTGSLSFLLFLAAVLALIASLAFLAIYHRAVTRSMRRQTARQDNNFGSSQTPARSGLPVPTQLEIGVLNDAPVATESMAEHLYTNALHAPWRLALLYMCAGLCFAPLITMSFLTSAALELHPNRFLPVLWSYARPVVPTISFVAGATGWTHRMVIVLYFVALLPLSLIPADGPPLVFQLVGFWLLSNVIPTILLFMFLNRRIRAVGQLVLIFLLTILTGSLIMLALVNSDERWIRAIADIEIALGLNATGVYIGLIIVGFIVAGPIGWALLQWIRHRYEHKQISDQSIILDAIWLFFGVSYAIPLVFEGPWWILSGICAFLLYKAITGAGFWLLGTRDSSTAYHPTLLLLRVFSLGKRHERLFDALALHWRYLGSIRLIAGPDLATTTVEPHEFLDFLTGKLDRRFIDGRQTLELRLAEVDMQPDRDGRFRVNDFFATMIPCAWCYHGSCATVMLC